MDWNDLRHFLALARHGSVRGAGEQLGVSHSTVARRLAGLEEALATRLFDRGRDGYVLTPAGRRLLPRAERVEAEVASLERDLVGLDDRLAGQVNVTCCDTWVSDLLLGPLTELCAEHPAIDLALTADSRSFDLTRREADIAIRILAIGAAPPEHLIASRMVPLKVGVYVSEIHRARLDPRLPGSSPRWLAFDDERQMRQLIATSPHADLDSWGAFGSLRVIAQAARRGLGLAFLPCYIGDADPQLRRLDDTPLRHMADLWMLSHPDLRPTRRLRIARSCVAEALRAHLPLFDGDRGRDLHR